uniref:Uncharacterized protein n=1 Tax=Anopheles maculatus TaxID=74869 RepID=A0A182TBM3_9DIPT
MAEETVNHLTNSQSTAKTMADRGVMIPGYCTFPRPAPTTARLSSVAEHTERQQVQDRDANSSDHFYTLRPAKMGGVGGRLNPTVGSVRKGPTAEDLAESNRNLLYEQNMSTFENFCERRNSEQRLQPPHQAGEEEPAERGPDSLGNFCTLRKVRRSRSGGDTVPGQQCDASRASPLGGAYCTLKKKKLQLNRKFVESFLEDPNAKVVDYLSELDAYLDEMDDEMCGEIEDSSEGDSEANSAGEDHCVEQKLPELDSKGPLASEKEDVGESLQYYQTNVRVDASAECDVTANDVYQEDRIRFGDIKHFCTLPKQKRTQFLNAFKRGASLRRSAVSQPKATDDCERRKPHETEPIPDEKIECEMAESRGNTNAEFEALSDQLAELEEHQLTIAESEWVVAALEAKIA